MTCICTGTPHTLESQRPHIHTSEVQRQKGKVRCVGHTEPKNEVQCLEKGNSQDNAKSRRSVISFPFPIDRS